MSPGFANTSHTVSVRQREFTSDANSTEKIYVCTSAKLFSVLVRGSGEGKEKVQRKKHEIAASHSVDSFHRPNATGTFCTVQQYFLCFICKEIPESVQTETNPRAASFESGFIVILLSANFYLAMKANLLISLDWLYAAQVAPGTE